MLVVAICGLFLAFLGVVGVAAAWSIIDDLRERLDDAEMRLEEIGDIGLAVGNKFDEIKRLGDRMTDEYKRCKNDINQLYMLDDADHHYEYGDFNLSMARLRVMKEFTFAESNYQMWSIRYYNPRTRGVIKINIKVDMDTTPRVDQGYVVFIYDSKPVVMFLAKDYSLVEVEYETYLKAVED